MQGIILEKRNCSLKRSDIVSKGEPRTIDSNRKSKGRPGSHDYHEDEIEHLPKTVRARLSDDFGVNWD